MKVMARLPAIGVRDDLVGADVLRDAAVLAGDHVGLADRVEQLGLAMVDVTHDGDHRRACGEVALATFVLAELKVEAFQQLAILVLGADDLNVIAELGTKQLQGLLVDRLRRSHHLAEVEHDLNQRRRVRADAIGEVGQRRAAWQPQHLTVATRNLHATNRRGLHVVELLTPLLLRFAATGGPTAGSATERARRPAATTATPRTGTTAASPWRTTGSGSRTAGPARTARTAPTDARTAGTGRGEPATGTARTSRTTRSGTAGCGATSAVATRTAGRGTRRHHAR